MKKVLFLCTGNSCRSQMAEGLVNYFLGDEWQAVSAGTHPTNHVHPFALKALQELNIPTDNLRSKHTDEFRDTPLDLVITVCDSAQETCPIWLGQGDITHISFPDPAHAVGTKEEIMTVFREVRDGIQKRVFTHLRKT